MSFPSFLLCRVRLLWFLLFGVSPFAVDAEVFRLSGEDATLRVSASVHGNADGEAAARWLAEMLGRITQRPWQTADGGESGIVLGVAADFPKEAKAAGLVGDDPFRREEYLLQSSKDRLLLLGATPLALQRAAADLLHRWGYRQFFPGPTWEVLPPSGELALEVDETSRPAYIFRDIFMTTHGKQPWEMDAFAVWNRANRMGSGFELNTRHSYNFIYRRNKAVFDENPSYFTTVDGEVRDAAKHRIYKFNAASPGLLNLLVEDAKAQFASGAVKDSISMDPSDHGGWDNTGEASRTIGSPSNQAVTMANQVAREVAAPLGRHVGMYAYYAHQYPPEIAVEPNIIVSFATRFLKPGEDVFRNIEAWKAKGVREVGIRDYSAYWPWDQAMPGRSLGGNLHYLQNTLRRYQEVGARFYTSEAQGSWGAYGLGYYTASRLLWNPSEKVEAVVDDFLTKAFGPASEPMRRFFNLMNGEDSVLARFTTPAQFYAPLLEALSLAAGDEAVTRRITALLAYVAYTEKLEALEKAEPGQKVAALNELYQWIFRIAPLQMVPVHGVALRRSKPNLQSVYPHLEHPAAATLAQWHEKAAPVTLAELQGLAGQSIKQDAQRAAAGWQRPLLPSEPGAVKSPWMRNSIAFTFPLEEAQSATARLAMRRFGFSGAPRYVVVAPSGEITKRGEMTGDRAEIVLEATRAGNYTLVFEPTPNVIRCEADQSFYLEPSRDFALLEAVDFTGSLYVDIPAGQETQLAAGGQLEGEKVGVTVFAADGRKVSEDKAASGTQPLVVSVPGEAGEGLLRIRYAKPASGAFEDLFLRFYGGYSAPVSLKKNAKPAVAAQ